MRTRKEIEKNFEKLAVELHGRSDAMTMVAVNFSLEVLLDIRELLAASSAAQKI